VGEVLFSSPSFGGGGDRWGRGKYRKRGKFGLFKMLASYASA